MKTILYIPLLFCSLFFFSCSKSSSNPQTPSAKVDIDFGTDTFNFGTLSISNAPYNSSSNSTFISNPSSSNTDLIGNISVLGDYFSLTSGGPSYRLSPGQSLTIVITFRPLAAGSYTGSVSIQHNVPSKSSPIVITLFGKAVK
jgi:hypothetical protein